MKYVNEFFSQKIRELRITGDVTKALWKSVDEKIIAQKFVDDKGLKIGIDYDFYYTVILSDEDRGILTFKITVFVKSDYEIPESK